MSAAPAQKDKTSTTARVAITNSPPAAAIQPRKNEYKIRERVIQDEENEERTHTDREIRTRWFKAINAHLTEDKITATRVKRNEQTLQRVKETWELALKRSADIPHNWIFIREVLVGRRP
ncbi:hypothetical protein F5888DRAFT_1302400 [Russula emetica]|nr:hypothetical protein F5888DRAFT_1302400 [Russula emetica]